nr:BREX-5 system adenine-specific DNA-methyltransferase PglX [Haloferax sp. BAB-2207]
MARDDVLGWVYEYYNASKLEELRHKRNQEGLEPEDVPPANQFYTPHWVVRMLTDNSLTKMYLEANGDLPATIEGQSTLSEDERKFRDTSPAESPSLADFSTYLVPTEKEGEAPTFDEPKDIRVIDPACGSGHFLLYAFDVLERIWHQERPDLARSEIPEKVLRYNLHGVDLDMRACQLAAFNLYLKARGRAEEEGAENFQMPEVGIVCADAKIANIGAASEIFDEVAGDQPDVRDALGDILEAFEDVQGLGSLLDVRGTLEEHFTTAEQPTIMESIEGPGSITKFLENLHQKVAEHRNGESFMAQDLRSFLRVLVILSQDYDVSLMNPPYGSGSGMPDVVREYVKEHYEYTPEFYINFFEVCDNLTKENGRIGMLVPRSFMFKRSFEDFREDFIGQKGSFDFLAEYGIGVLDNATVRTVGTVVRSGESQTPDSVGSFLRLHDLDSKEKEQKFLSCTFNNPVDENGIQRFYEREMSEFDMISGSPVSYWVPQDLRSLYDSDIVLDADNGRVDKDSLGAAKVGLQTGDDGRFLRYFWESNQESWVPFAKGGEDAWMLPRVNLVLDWSKNGSTVKRYSGSYPRNDQYYFSEALTYTVAKEGGRRFGYLQQDSVFGHKGSVFIPDRDIWSVLSYLNSNLFTYLMLCQTPERMWEIGEVSKVPWYDSLAEIDALEENSEEILGLLLKQRQHDFESPYYTGPKLLEPIIESEPPEWYEHSHRNLVNSVDTPTIEEQHRGETTLRALAITAAKRRESIKREIEQRASEIEQTLFDHFDINEDKRDVILQEIALRTNDDPRESQEYDPESITEPTGNFEELVKDLLLHLTLKITQEDDDGIVPLVFEADNEKPLIERLEAEFERIFGDAAQDRLAEADQVLGDKQPDSGAYPNLQSWIVNDLFEYHLQKFKNTPVLWRLTTERLVSDPKEEGFACIVDYHQLGASLFDRIESRYLEPLKIEYRDRRASADQRRSDSSLSTTEQAEAAEEYERYESALAQINEFQEATLDLSSPHPPERDEAAQSMAADLKPKVVEFRERTAERLSTLDELVDEMDPNKFEDHFSPKFLDRVNERRDEWLDALDDLEAACKAYSQDKSIPVEAHLYDLFSYIDDNVGSTYHGSNDITFMNHYFSKGDKYLDHGEPREGLEGVPRLLAELAAETDEDVELGEVVKEGCNQLSKLLPSDWEERALQEVLATGYSPVKKHGVTINIQPLAEQNIVPESVDDKVL